ncbi:MAG TPA: aminomethyl-transferring glycine dehydrogenase subunit GcvPB [Spirochaetia bacterium]|nr:aminomethyl-transferring glycine dehydrogenase subunit GcvPB [Spirochaetia bacterium]
MRREKSLLFETSRPGRIGYRLPVSDIPSTDRDAVCFERFGRGLPPGLPELSEVDVVRHYTNLAHDNYCVDLGFYPLGSCTMKYNPKINDELAQLEGFTNLHPLQDDEDSQGTLALMHDLLQRLCKITGMSWGTLQPFAGAQGEFTGMKLFHAYFARRGEAQRTKILVPDSAHGTNPASAHIAGFDVQEIKSDRRGMVSLESIREHLDENLAGIMLTNPNTLGLFEQDIVEIANAVHEAGGLLYYDGANLNAIMGKVRPGDMGFDVVHLNLHKTFSTPHGGGGPGAGPVLVNERLRPFLPIPDIEEADGKFRIAVERPHSIGRVAGFYGNVGVLIRAYAYLLSMGGNGLAAASERAVLNANYLKQRLREYYKLPFDTLCKHEFVLSASKQKDANGVSALDIAKRLLDYRIHPPTIYFPLVVAEAMMIEPTETESKEVLDDFVKVMAAIAEEARQTPQKLHDAPTETSVRRLDEVLAAKKPVVAWRRD